MTVERVADVADAIAWACDYEGAVVLDFRVEREVNVFPMVPVNKSIGEMMTEAPQPVAV
jgi:acetolactate synthase-1/2/3 large subunit